MKVTIKKLIKMGVEKAQIKELLNIDEEKYMKYDKQGRAVNIDNLANKIDYIAQGGDSEDLKFSEVFDNIFKMNNMDLLKLETKKKAELIKEFPNFIKYIEMKKITDEIGVLDKKREGFINQIREIENDIKSLNTKMDLLNGIEHKEESTGKEEIKKEIQTLVINEDVKIYRVAKNGNLKVHIRKEGFEIGDIIDLANERGINRYKIISETMKGTQQLLEFKENIMTKVEG